MTSDRSGRDVRSGIRDSYRAVTSSPIDGTRHLDLDLLAAPAGVEDVEVVDVEQRDLPQPGLFE